MVSDDQKKKISKVLEPFRPFKVWVFGSYARNENKEDSDLDLIVRLGKRVNLLDFIGIEQQLSEALGIKVDLAIEGSIDPLVKPYIENDIMPLMVNEE
ncbi:MAG: nucleotidyltransferase family protein [Flammeovirgaceae bacterium]|nr:nucleotidyltransferase family protein [Flammeovirgaceae bacterium]